MYRMGNSSRHLGWLLLTPEPTEQERGWSYPKFLLLGGGLFVAGALLSPSYDFGGLWRLGFGFYLVALAVLFLVPADTRPCWGRGAR